MKGTTFSTKWLGGLQGCHFSKNIGRAQLRRAFTYSQVYFLIVFLPLPNDQAFNILILQKKSTALVFDGAEMPNYAL